MAAYKDEQRGTWYVSFHYYDWTGKNCRKVKRGFKTKREATEWEHHFRMKEAADLDMTFGEFVQAYTRDMKPKLKHNTWLTKEHILRTKLLPYFENKKMCDIRAKDIIQWQNKQISYRDEKGKPYAPTYLKTLQSELSALFNHAVRFYESKSNPVVKAGPLGKGKAEEMLFWTKEEYLKFIETVKDKPYSYQAFQILYWCGLRVGDKATPHLHIDFVPYTTGSKRGLDTRVSLKQALSALGFKGGTRRETELNQWVAYEKKQLAAVMLEHGIEWEQKGTHEKHLSVLDFEKKERAKEVAELEQSISDGKERLSDIQIRQRKAEQETEQI